MSPLLGKTGKRTSSDWLKLMTTTRAQDDYTQAGERYRTFDDREREAAIAAVTAPDDPGHRLQTLHAVIRLRATGVVADELEAAYLLGCVLEERGKAAEAADVYLDLMRQELTYRDVEDRYRRLAASTRA